MKKGHQTFSILFWLNKQRGRTQKPVIYMRLTMDQKRINLTTHQHITSHFWNNKMQCVKVQAEEAQSINRQLATMRADINRHYSLLVSLGKPITVETLKNAYLGIGEKQRTLQEAIDFYITRFTEKVQTGKKALNSLKAVRTTRDKIIAFLKYNYRVSDIYLKDIKSSFGPDLEHFLSTIQRLGNNTSTKYIKILKRVLKMAVEQEWLTANPLIALRCSYEQPDRQRLTMEEVVTLYKKELPIARLSEVRDIFLFSCFTGYAYQDVFGLTAENIIIGIDGEKWISKERQKTNSPERIPLLPIALEIIEKYKAHPYCLLTGRLLPVNSNQRYNGYLKEIAIICDIRKYLTTHTARHTFATTITLENDVPIETVSQMLGHKSIRTTQIYAKVTQKKVSNNIKVLREKLFVDGKELKLNNG